jgi:hypothetical protein
MDVSEFEASIYRFDPSSANTQKEERNKENTTTSLSTDEKPKKITRRARKGKPVLLRLSPKLLFALDHICAESDMTRTDWIKGAIMRGMKNWTSPYENQTLWPKCHHCGKKHDPSIHGLDEFGDG